MTKFKEHFSTGKVIIHTNRHYTGDSDSGDIDLVVFEPKSDCLLIAEVKGFIHPDSTEEVVQANQKLKKGLEQITRIQDWLNTLDQNEQSSRLGLPNFSRPPSVEFAVIGNGFVGSDYLCIPDGISIVDAEYLLLPKFKEKSIFDAVHEYQKRLLEENAKADQDFLSSSVTLAGITFELPSWIAAK